MIPNPGSDEALAQGCTCPVITNGYGKGLYNGKLFWMRIDCPLHGQGENKGEKKK